MVKSVSIEGLDDEQAHFIRELVEFLRTKKQRKQAFTRTGAKGRKRGEVAFATYPLGVKGELTRKKIYEGI